MKKSIKPFLMPKPAFWTGISAPLRWIILGLFFVLLLVLANEITLRIDEFATGRLARKIFTLAPPSATGPISINQELFDALSPEDQQALLGSHDVNVFQVCPPQASALPEGPMLVFTYEYYGPVCHVLYNNLGGPSGLIQGSLWYFYVFGYWFGSGASQNLEGEKGPRSFADLEPPANSRQDSTGTTFWGLPKGFGLLMYFAGENQTEYNRIDFIRDNRTIYISPENWKINVPSPTNEMSGTIRKGMGVGHPYVQVGTSGDVIVYLRTEDPDDNSTGVRGTALLTEFRLRTDTVAVRRLVWVGGEGDLDHDGLLEVEGQMRWPHTICAEEKGRPYQPHPTWEFGPDGLRPDDAATRTLTIEREGSWEGDEPKCLPVQ
jgi:hypothetical protein